MTKTKILIIDDDKDFIADLALLLEQDFKCQGVFSGEDGLELLNHNYFDLILLDIDLGAGIDGYKFLDRIKEMEVEIPIIMISKYESINKVVKAIKKGAYDYVGKKPDLSELKIIINRALDDFGRRRENKFLKQEIRQQFEEFLGESEPIQNIKSQIIKIAAVDSTILITGESGTGKEIIARKIHDLSSRKDKPFVAVNCAAIPGSLFESELFGHERGAFTGAINRKNGKFEIANHGTIFLDEIAEMDISTQAKLLRVLQQKTIERLGGRQNIPINVRIIAATNKNLKDLIKQKKFREDLFFRLNIFPIHVPPLRERRGDLPLLAQEFVRKKSSELKKNILDIHPHVINNLISYDCPGNVRELENMIERAIILATSTTLTPDLFPDILPHSAAQSTYAVAKKQAEERFQREYIPAMLRLANKNITRAAEMMGVTRQGLQKMIKYLTIDLDRM